jgi:hypothetical protein
MGDHVDNGVADADNIEILGGRVLVIGWGWNSGYKS